MKKQDYFRFKFGIFFICNKILKVQNIGGWAEVEKLTKKILNQVSMETIKKNPIFRSNYNYSLNYFTTIFKGKKTERRNI